MQHPFAGVLKSEQVTSDRKVKPANPTTSRRGLFGLLAGVVAVGTFGFLNASKAQAQSTTLMLGEEGGGRRATTFAVGEEGGGGQRVTTFAVGEEGGGQRVTTHAVGEEGGGQRVTTYAVGEEGGRPPLRVRS
jgi:hypothetical protein